MKHFFVVNPAAGKGKRFEQLIDTIRRVCDVFMVDGQKTDYEVYVTTEPGDATAYVKDRCRDSGMQQVRFYACGGDGTLSEIANGAVGYSNAEIGIMPAGTGNDFARNFSNQDNFKNIEYQLRGSARMIDLIKYETENGIKHGINMVNIGFDGDVAAKVAQIKRNPLVRDGFAYIAGVGIVLMKKLGSKIHLTIDGTTTIPEREMLLVAIANGSYCGGGFKAAPKAMLDDGMMDVCLVDLISRVTFLKFINLYKTGKHLESAQTQRLIKYMKCKTLEIGFGAQRDICVDGEIERSEWIRLSSMPQAVKFSVPYGSHCLNLAHGQPAPTEEAAMSVAGGII